MNIDKHTLDELRNFKNEIDRELEKRSNRSLYSDQNYYIYCAHCNHSLSRLYPTDDDIWWSVGLHCDSCGKHSLVDVNYNGKGSVWLNIIKVPDMSPGSISITLFCNVCGASKEDEKEN